MENNQKEQNNLDKQQHITFDDMQMMGFSIKLRPIVYAIEYSFSIDGRSVYA